MKACRRGGSGREEVAEDLCRLPVRPAREFDEPPRLEREDDIVKLF